ncbi:MAG: phosphatidylglycerophosphatase A [Candidatus Eisenbacteria sp.]|nr:phosphatidylglycerophosphatase A [Candidatus Eisenbacteria bacterium]
MKARHPVEKPIGGFDASLDTVISTFFGTGFFPVAPASFASAVVAVLMLLAGGLPIAMRAALLVLVSVVGTWAAGRTETRYGHDARCIVIDEVGGMLAATLLIPWDLKHLIVAFLFFRLCDVLKLPPAYQLESLPGGAGIMADDIAAGFQTLILLFAAGVLLPFF